MGQKSIDIVNLDVKKLIELLNIALSEEWLAYYQYWIGAKVAEGSLRIAIVPELLEHANEELGHAELIVERIIQLGGTPILNPKDWFLHSGCQYMPPENPRIKEILKQNLEGERCAIDRYQQIASFTEGKDYSTYQMAVKILDEELEHEEDIEGWLTDIKRFKEEIKNAGL